MSEEIVKLLDANTQLKKDLASTAMDADTLLAEAIEWRMRAELAEAKLAERDAVIAELQVDRVDDSATGRSVVSFIEDLYFHWDSDEDQKVGKLLIAANGKIPGYSLETDDLAKRLHHLSQRSK